MNVDTTTMDPIVYANTYHDVEKKALEHGHYLHYRPNTYWPYEIRDFKTNTLINAFGSLYAAARLYM